MVRSGYNAPMSTSTRDYMETILNLPEGATLVLQNISWDDYERVLEELMDRHRLRVTYDRGRLEIMSTLSEHEQYVCFINRLVGAFADRFDINLEMRGQTTWKRRELSRGLEADSCYYVANAERIIGTRNIDLEFDPPPDIAVEIDITNESLSKFSIYAALNVPEIWRYDSENVQFYELSGESYSEIFENQLLPGLKPEMLSEALEQSKTEGQTSALRAFRQRLV
jgi:Uma2 family endonuclease